MSFLTDRSKSTKLNGFSSFIIDITRSISLVQGSAIGPYAFITYVSDNKTRGHANRMFKYGDDCTLLVPENTDISAENEIANISSWSHRNKHSISLNGYIQ